MAIHSNNPSSNPTAALANALNNAQQSTAQVDNSQSRVRGMDWLEQGSDFRDPIRRSIGTEAVNNITKALNENLENGTKGFKDAFTSSVIVLDKSVYTTLAFSCVLVCLKEKNSRENVVSYHTLIVESTNDSKLTRTEQINGRAIEITMVAGDAYDFELIRIAQQALEQEFPGAIFSRTDATRVPRSFTEDSEAKEVKHYTELAANSVTACYVDLKLRSGASDISMANARGDKSLVVELDFKDRVIKDIVNEPIRSDVNVRFFSEQQAQNNTRSLNNGSTSKPIAHVSGFIDLMWSPVSEDSQGFAAYGSNMNNGARPTQKYAANYVITDVLPDAAATPATVMLAIATAVNTLRVDNNYYGAFVPKHHLGGRVDSHDIGAINYEVNLGNVPVNQEINRIDTNAANFSVTDLGQLLAASIRPGLAVSVDIPETSPQAWYMSVLRSAAMGNQGAVDSICKSLNDLTNNRFSGYFKGGNLFINSGYRVYGGTYVTAEGEVRDIRDVDYLYLLNCKQAGFMETVRAWSDSRLGTNVSIEERMHTANRVIQAVIPSANVSCYYHRVTFNDAVIQAILLSLKDCGTAPRIRTPFNSGELMAQRQVASTVADALGNPQSQVTLFNQGYASTSVNNGHSYGAATRYGSY